MQGTVFFIGAGPGDPELITVKGLRLLQQADLVLYAGSLVPRALAALAGPRAELRDSSGMTLEETHALMREAVEAGKQVVRLHTGDAGLYGALREQKALLDADGIPCAVVPGISAAFAAAAAAGVGFTVPERVQSLAITEFVATARSARRTLVSGIARGTGAPAGGARGAVRSQSGGLVTGQGLSKLARHCGRR